MPAPAIKYPPGVSVSRTGAVTYKRPAALGKPAQDFGVVGHVEAIRNHLPSDLAAAGDADGWIAKYADGGRVRTEETREIREGNSKRILHAGEPLEPFKGQREAVRAVLQAQGFWPAHVRPEPKYPKHEARRDGKPVRPGDAVHDFRGEAGVYEMISRIPEPEEGKTGKVIVNGGEFYAKVWGLEIVQVSDA